MASRWVGHAMSTSLCLLLLVLQPIAATKFVQDGNSALSNGRRSFRATVSAVDLASKVAVAEKDGSLQKGSTNEAVDQEFTIPSKDCSIELSNHFNVQYSGRFTIGDQELPMIYDTGSFEVLVLSTKCTNCVKTLSMYDYKKSHSFRESPSHVVAEHAFVSGDVVTAEGFETLRLGGRDSAVDANDMTFWMVQKHELKFWKTGNAIFSGIVGLSHVKRIPDGFGGDAAEDRSLLEEMHLDAFALCYQRGGLNSPGWLKFGPSINAMSRDRRGFQSVDVSGDSHWATKLSKFKVDLDGIDTSSLCRPSCGALIDSGTSLLTFPRSASHITEALKRKVKSDCSNLDELPTLFFELDGAEVVLPPRAYIFKVTENGSPACRGAFMKVDKESQFGEVFILGMPFLRYYFTVFDRANKQVHIARSTEDCKVAPHPSLLATNATVGLTSADFAEATSADLGSVIFPAWLKAPGDFLRL